MKVIIQCNHCNKEVVVNYTEKDAYSILYFCKKSGMIMIPPHRLSSAPGKYYCKDCIVFQMTKPIVTDNGITVKEFKKWIKNWPE